MNNLVIDDSLNIEEVTIDTDMDLTINTSISKKIIFDIQPNICLKIFDTSKNTSNDIVFNVANNCNIIINKLSVDCNDKIIMNLNGENINLKFYTSIINYKDNSYKQIINHNDKNIDTSIVNHCINVLNNEFKFVVDANLIDKATNASFKQDNKIININNGKSFILPNLIVDNNDIDASHSAYIGTFDEDILFYMMTRGITFNEANRILIKAFLINKMDLEDKEDIYNSIIDNMEVTI